MNLKIVSPFPSAPSFSGSNEVITNRWPLPRSPKEIDPEGIPVLFGEEEIRQLNAKPIAWPCDDATNRWISENLNEPLSVSPEEPQTYQTLEF